MERPQRWLSLLITATILGALVWWTQWRTISSQPKVQADAAIWAMVQACRKGDVRGYLGCFAGKLQARLAQVAREQGKQTFAALLRQMLAPVKGIAVFAPESTGQGLWKVVAEFTFADRTERQTFHVRREGKDWKIVRIESARPAPVLIPYGTPVEEL